MTSNPLNAAFCAPCAPSTYLSPVEAPDPTLDACCQREVESQDRHQRALDVVRANDRIMQRERAREEARKGVLCNCPLHVAGAATSYGLLESLRELEVAKQRLTDPSPPPPPPSASRDADSRRISDSGDDSESDDDSEFDYLLDEGAASATIHAEILQRQALHSSLRSHGFGAMLHVSAYNVDAVVYPPSYQDFPLLLHLYDPDNVDCAHLDLHLEKFSSSYVGTRWIRCDGRQFLSTDNAVQKGKVLEAFKGRGGKASVPALLAFRSGLLVNVSENLRDFGAQCYKERNSAAAASKNLRDPPAISFDAVDAWLSNTGLLQTDIPQAMLSSDSSSNSSNARFLSGDLCLPTESPASPTSSPAKAPTEEPVDPESIFECSEPGCCKTFFHRHIGSTFGEAGALLREGLDDFNM